MTARNFFQEKMTQYAAQFNYNPSTQTWCLSGTDAQGNYWETDDFDASTLKDAQDEAISYLEAYNEPDPSYDFDAIANDISDF
jgi:hypothetical protein